MIEVVLTGGYTCTVLRFVTLMDIQLKFNADELFVSHPKGYFLKLAIKVTSSVMDCSQSAFLTEIKSRLLCGIRVSLTALGSVKCSKLQTNR